MTVPQSHSVPTPSSSWRHLIAPALLLLAVFVLSEHTLTISLNDHHAATQEEMEGWTAGGDFARQLAFLTLGGLGAIYVVRHQSRSLDLLLALPLVALLAWCVLSVLWSVEPGTSARRAAVLLLWSAGAIGFALRFHATDVAKIVLLVSGLMIALGLVVELALGTFRPWAEGYRFAGTVHPNTQAVGCALVCLSAGALGLMPQKKNLWMVLLAATGFGFLVLTRSRTSLLAMLLGAAMLWMLSASLRTKLVMGVAACWSLAVALFAMVLTTANFDQRLASVALLGREEQSESLTGRVPLWEELLTYAARRPLQGYGYQAFWTRDHIDAITHEMEWAITEAHCAYLDGLLQIGAIGVLLALTALLAALWRCRRRVQSSPAPGEGFLYAALVLCVVQAMTESAMSSPMWAPWAVVCGVCTLAFRRHGAAEQAEIRVTTPEPSFRYAWQRVSAH